MSEKMFRNPFPPAPESEKPSVEQVIDAEITRAEAVFAQCMEMVSKIDDMAGSPGDYMVDERYESYGAVRNYAFSLMDRADMTLAALYSLKQLINDAEPTA
ncbi:hypothetical protein IT407_00740 [Candidatus Uhrbacteria bacterium]|nr:hypothetical protein [Candidatus Uhrbacteria bacterium]